MVGENSETAAPEEFLGESRAEFRFKNAADVFFHGSEFGSGGGGNNVA